MLLGDSSSEVTKRCSKCKELKTLPDFHKDKHRPDGRTTACRYCRTPPAKKGKPPAGWVENGIGHIPLTQGKTALVDAENLEGLCQHRWFAALITSNQSWYAIRKYKNRQVRMHREVVGLGNTTRPLVDHINHDTLDNRKQNLRTASDEQNTQNAKKRKDNTTGAKGVTFSKAEGKYTARIQTSKERVFLGYFDTAQEAAEAYQRAAQEKHQEFAYY